MHLVGFITRIYHDARFSECQINFYQLVESTVRWSITETVQHGNKNNKGIMTIIIVINTAHVGGKNESDTGDSRGNWDHRKITQTIPEQRARKAQN